jgi:hypothetical protein
MDIDFVQLVSEVGFPISAALSAGYFVFLAVKFLLSGVTSSIKSMENIIKSLDKRIDIMNNEVERIDIKISHALGLQPNFSRISRATANDVRKD